VLCALQGMFNWKVSQLPEVMGDHIRLVESAPLVPVAV
jgi:hypothetical protein